ncbi:MAG: helix-turn-helix domain-containing protein [Gemmataceae bacterium]
MTIPLLTKSEAADRLRISVRSLDRLRSVGAIRAVRVRGSVRIAEAEIEKFITKNTAKSVNQPKEFFP